MKDQKILAGDAFSQGLLKKGTLITFSKKMIKGKITTDVYMKDGYKTFTVTESSTGSEFFIYPKYNSSETITIHAGGIVASGKNMVKTVSGDLSELLGENKALVYWFGIIFLVDYYVFDKKFKKKLEHIFGSIIDKATSIISKDEKEGKVAAEA